MELRRGSKEEPAASSTSEGSGFSGACSHVGHDVGRGAAFHFRLTCTMFPVHSPQASPAPAVVEGVLHVRPAAAQALNFEHWFPAGVPP